MNITKSLCDTLYMSESDILSFAVTAPHRYKRYEIPKRNGQGTRTIAHPSKELKFFQRLAVSFLEDLLPIHDSAFAYRRGLSIKDNAEVHLNGKYLLKMDFKDFFPSITPDLFFESLSREEIALTEKDRLILSHLLFWKPRRNSALRLSIGAPSSPLISNFVMLDFDRKISEVCAEMKVNYTRYADDISFSTNVRNILFDFPDIVNGELNSSTNGRISVNLEKTIFSSKKHNRHITGITLSNDNKISLGRERKRSISAMIHKYKNNQLSNESFLKLQGLMAFSKFIEPEFHSRMCTKYGEDIIYRILNEK